MQVEWTGLHHLFSINHSNTARNLSDLPARDDQERAASGDLPRGEPRAPPLS